MIKHKTQSRIKLILLLINHKYFEYFLPQKSQKIFSLMSFFTFVVHQQF